MRFHFLLIVAASIATAYRNFLKLLNSDRVSCAAFAIALTIYVLRRLLWLQSEAPAYHGAPEDFVCVLVAFAALLSGVYAIRTEKLGAFRAAVIGGSLGLIYFVATMGIGLADPTNVDWLMRGDWATHFLGWHFFRNASWGWPLGAFDSYWHPIGTSVLYTDSLPLLAIPLKVFNGLLPPRFQYIGGWILVNCVMQGIFGALLIRCFTYRVTTQAMGAAFLLVTPILITRVAQDTLTAQWLILACLWIYFRNVNARDAFFPWLVVCFVSALVHPYLCVMVLMLMLAYYVRTLASRTLDRLTILRHVGTAITLVIICWWLSGAFIIKIRSGFEAGADSSNLLTWINAETFSRWLPALPLTGDAQFEGVGYLGLGVLILCALSVGYFVFARLPNAATRPPITTLVIAVALMTLFAFSTRLTWGSSVLVDFTPTHLRVLGAFRNCGRFIWPSVYLITLGVVVCVARRAGPFATSILALAFFVQLLDLAPLQISHARMREGLFVLRHEPVLTDAYWHDVMKGKRHIVLFPASNCGIEAAPYFPFSLLAADEGATINTGYLARFDGIRRATYCRQLESELDAGIRDPQTLYVLRADLVEHFKATSTTTVECRKTEGYSSCVVGDNSANIE